VLRFIFKNVHEYLNINHHFENYGPISVFKVKVTKVEYSDEDVDNVSLDLDTKEVL